MSGLQQWFYQYQHVNHQDVLQRFEKLVGTWERKVQTDAEKCVHRINDKGEKLYLTPEGNITTQAENVVIMQRNGEAVYKAPPPAKSRTNQGKGYTLAELSELFFDDHYRQTHIEGKWVDVQQYVSNTQNRMSEQVIHQPLTDAFLFGARYIANNRQEVQQIINELQQLHAEYSSRHATLCQQLDAHLWLSEALSTDVLKPLQQAIDTLVGYQSRIAAVIEKLDTLQMANPEASLLENTHL